VPNATCHGRADIDDCANAPDSGRTTKGDWRTTRSRTPAYRLALPKLQLPALEARSSLQINRIALLLATAPVRCPTCSIRRKAKRRGRPPDLALGCRRRSPCAVPTFAPPKPAYEATAKTSRAPISIPRSLGGNFDLESYRAATCSNGAASWALARASTAPVRRRAAQTHHPPRELEQRSGRFLRTDRAARAVEIDDALNAYQAERVENAKLAERREAARQALAAQPAMAAGIVTWIDVLTRDAPIIRPAGKAGTAMPG
jgi:hypothetical protein